MKRKKDYKEWNNKSDEELMHLLQQGERDVMILLMRRYKERIITFIFRYVGVYETAVDVAQEVFVRVFRFCNTFTGNDKFSNWIFTIAANLARSEFSKALTRPKLTLDANYEDGDEERAQIIDESYMPDSRVDSSIAAQIIQKALMSLPPNHRMMVIMRDVQELSYDEIAMIEGIEVGTVKSRINRGRLQLQVLLRSLYDELVE